jgi:hypothetical protein
LNLDRDAVTPQTPQPNWRMSKLDLRKQLSS